MSALTVRSMGAAGPEEEEREPALAPRPHRVDETRPAAAPITPSAPIAADRDDDGSAATAAESAPPECSICLAEVLETQHRAAAHPDSGCTHVFHWACLADSLALSSLCPLCRRPFHTHGIFEISATGERRHHIPDERHRQGPAGGGEEEGWLYPCDMSPRTYCIIRTILKLVPIVSGRPLFLLPRPEMKLPRQWVGVPIVVIFIVNQYGDV